MRMLIDGYQRERNILLAYNLANKMKRVFNKFSALGSISVRFKYDIMEFQNACLSGYASRKTKRQMKRLAAQANRRYIKKLTLEETKDEFENGDFKRIA